MLVADIDQDGRLTIRTPDRAALIDGGAAAELVDKMTEARLLVNAEGPYGSRTRRCSAAGSVRAESPALQPEAIRLRRQIEPNYRIWSETRLEADLLQRGTTLATAEDIIDKHPGAFPAELTDYIKRSVEAAEARSRAEELRARQDAFRARRRTYAVAGIAVLLAGFRRRSSALYEDARHNFLLALLTRTDQYLIEGMPSHALAMAEQLDPVEPGRSGHVRCQPRPIPESDEAVRVRTISQITQAREQRPFAHVGSHQPRQRRGLHRGRHQIRGWLRAMARSWSVASIAPVRIPACRVTRAGFGPYRSAPDGKYLASASSHEVLLWDLDRGEAQSLCDGGAHFTDVVFDPRGQYLAWSSRDGLVTVRDLETSRARSFKINRRRPGRSPLAATARFWLRPAATAASSFGEWTIGVCRIRSRPEAADLISIAFEGTGKKLAAAALTARSMSGRSTRRRRRSCGARPGASGKALEDQVFA